jgi:hypothetical protein
MERRNRRPSSAVVDAKVVRLQNKTVSSLGSVDETVLPGLMKRASDASRQVRYFRLVAQKSSFEEVVPSSQRAGFTLLEQDTRREEAVFQWSSGEPDFTFLVSFKDISRASVIAESRGDIFGLILTSYSHAPSVSVETNPSLGNRELGRHALLFRDILLILPEFDETPAWTKY